MLSFVERCQSVLAGVILALLIASVVLVPQNRALADEGHGGGIGQDPKNCLGYQCDLGCGACVPRKKQGPINDYWVCEKLANAPQNCACNNPSVEPKDCSGCGCHAIYDQMIGSHYCVCTF